MVGSVAWEYLDGQVCVYSHNSDVHTNATSELAPSIQSAGPFSLFFFLFYTMPSLPQTPAGLKGNRFIVRRKTGSPFRAADM